MCIFYIKNILIYINIYTLYEYYHKSKLYLIYINLYQYIEFDKLQCLPYDVFSSAS